MRTCRRKTLFTAITVFFGLVAGLCLTEMALRFFSPQPTGPIRIAWNPELGPVQVPMQHARRTLPGVYSYSYRNNSLGLRGSREYTIPKQPNVRRILFLGDSFTYGEGVNDEETFASAVQRNLAASALKVEVINAGVCGTGTDHALNFFLKVGHTYNPDVVALFFFSNDFGDNSEHTYFYLTPAGFPKPTVTNAIQLTQWLWLRYIPAYDWLISWSHLANLLKQAAIRWSIVQANEGTEPIRGGTSHPNVQRQPSRPKGWEETVVLLRNLQRKAELAGATFVIFYVPSEDEVGRKRASQPTAPAEVLIADFCRTNQIGFYSITPVLAASPYALASLYFREGHWTALAHQIVGDFITNSLRTISSISGDRSLDEVTIRNQLSGVLKPSL